MRKRLCTKHLNIQRQLTSCHGFTFIVWIVCDTGCWLALALASSYSYSQVLWVYFKIKNTEIQTTSMQRISDFCSNPKLKSLSTKKKNQNSSSAKIETKI